MADNKTSGPNSSNAQTFAGRKGTGDQGKDFEELMIISKCLQLTLDSNVVEFSISSDDAAFGDFDDLVIETKDINGKEEKTAFQLKHVEAKDKLLTPKILGGTGDKFSISKYYKSCGKIPADFSLILYTNKKFEMEDGKLTMDCKIGPAEILVDILKPNIDNLYRFAVNNSVNISGETEAYEKFLNRFQLMSNQENVKQLEIRVVNHFLGIHGTEDTFHRFRDFIKRWKKEKKHKLNKKMVTIKIVESLLSPHIKTINDELYYTDFGDLLRRAVLSFNLTTFEETNEVIHKIWINYLTDNEVNKCGFNNFLLKERLEQIMDEKLRGLKYSLISWHLGQSPLIVEVTRTSKAAIYQAVKLLEKNQIEDRKLLLLDQKETLQNSRSFQNLDCLKTANQSVYQEILETFSCSLQGRLHKLQDIVDSEDFAKIVSTDCLVKIIDPNFNIGGQAEELPEFYVPRALPRILIDFKFLEEEKTDLILINCNGKKEDVKKRIKDVRIIVEADELLSDGKTLPGVVIDKTKKIICLHPTECSPEEYSATIKKFPTKNCHRISYCEECLEWMDTRGDVEVLRSYRTARELFEEEDAFLQSNKRLIKIVCADSGMGKTTLLKHFYNLKSKPFWLLHLTVRQYASRIAEDMNVKNFVLSLTTDTLERKFMETFYDRRKIIFIWDGLDEVLDDEERQRIYGFIKNIRHLGFVQFITARCSLQAEIEKKLNTLGTNIRKLSKLEQDSFLKNRLSRKYNHEQLSDITTKITENVQKILEIPLQLYLLTELLLQAPNTDDITKNPLTVTSLIHHFVNNKLSTHFAKFKTADTFSQKIVKETVIRRYKLLGTKICLKSIVRLNFFNQSELNDLTAIEEEDDLFGLVKKSPEMSHFLHRSYAEYFAALFLSENHGRIRNFEIIYFDKRCRNLRFMLDLILAGDCPAHVAVLYEDLEALEIHKETILKEDAAGRNALHIALYWSYDLLEFKEKVRMLATITARPEATFIDRSKARSDKFQIIGRILNYLQEVTPVLDKMLNIDCVSYLTGTFSKLAVLTDDINIVKFVHQKEDDGLSLINAAFTGNQEICKFLIDNGAKVNFIAERGFTPLMYAAVGGHLQAAKFLIDNKAEINMTDVDGQTSLLLAVKFNYFQLVQLLMENGAEVNLPCKSGTTPLMVAAEEGFLDITKLLIDKAEVNMTNGEGESALFLAARKNELQLVQLLIENKAEVNLPSKNGLTPLMTAAMQGHFDIARVLIESKAKVNMTEREKRSSLFFATWNNQVPIVELLLSNNAEVNLPNEKCFTPLMLAAIKGYLDIAMVLIFHEADVNLTNSEGRSALFFATCKNQFPIAQLLIRNNSKVNLRSETGTTPLIVAAAKGYLDIAKILIDNKAEVNLTDGKRQSPLLFAATNNNLKIAQLLIDNKADINYPSQNGTTPLMVACGRGYLEMVSYLLEKKAEINCKNNYNGETALHVSVRRNNLDIRDLLIRSGADVEAKDKNGKTPAELAEQSPEVN